MGKRIELFDDDVSVTNDLTLSVQLLGSREIVGLRVHKRASLHVLDGHRDSESRVLLESVTVGGNLELRGRHVVSTWDGANWYRVA